MYQCPNARVGLFGTHISGRTQEKPNLVKSAFRACVRRDGLCKPEVDDARRRFPVHFRNQDICWLQIAMDDGLLMGMLHAFASLDEQFPVGRRILSFFRSQYSVIGSPCTYSITKYGWPCGVVPASNTLAIAG